MLKISLASERYDRVQAIFDGRVRIEGCDVTAVPLRAEEAFHRAFNGADFDVTELSASSYMMTLSRGEAPYVAVPVFLSKVFRHSAIYIRTDRGIQAPQDLVGKRIRHARIPDDRLPVGARHSRGRVRRAAARHHMVHRRPGRAGPARAIAAFRRQVGVHHPDRVRPDAVRHARCRRARRDHLRPRAELLPAESPGRTPVREFPRRRGAVFPQDRHLPDHASARHPPHAARPEPLARA